MRSNKRRKLDDLEKRAATVGRAGGWLSVSNSDPALPAGCYSDRDGNVYTRDQLRDLESQFAGIIIYEVNWRDGVAETPETAGDRVIALTWGDHAEDDETPHTTN